MSISISELADSCQQPVDTHGLKISSMPHPFQHKQKWILAANPMTIIAMRSIEHPQANITDAPLR